MRKTTICFVISVRPHGTCWLPLNGFLLNFICEVFSKIYRENSRLSEICTVVWCFRTYQYVALSVLWTMLSAIFAGFRHISCNMIQINEPTRCNSFTSLLLDVYVWLNMFRASPRPFSGAYNCTRSLWFYRSREAAETLLVVVWPVIITCYVWLNMFRASSRPSSGAYNCTRSLWFYSWRKAAGTLLVVV